MFGSIINCRPLLQKHYACETQTSCTASKPQEALTGDSLILTPVESNARRNNAKVEIMPFSTV